MLTLRKFMVLNTLYKVPSAKTEKMYNHEISCEDYWYWSMSNLELNISILPFNTKRCHPEKPASYLSIFYF